MSVTGPPSAWDVLEGSLLMAAGGWMVTRLLSDRALAALAAEALALGDSAEEARLDRSPDEESFRGNPARWLDSAPGGGGLNGFYRSPALRGLLERLTGLPWTCSGDGGSWSYYRREGHHLDVHRDIDACDLAVITCVHEEGVPVAGESGVLSLWPTRIDDDLAAVRSDPEPSRGRVRLRPGDSIVLLGGVMPHRLEPIAAGHVRVVAPLCFRCTA